MGLDELRAAIDGIDENIVRLLGRRADIAARIGEEKRRDRGPLTDAEREEAVLKHVAAANRGPISEAALKEIYRRIIVACTDVQRTEEA